MPLCLPCTTSQGNPCLGQQRLPILTGPVPWGKVPSPKLITGTGMPRIAKTATAKKAASRSTAKTNVSVAKKQSAPKKASPSAESLNEQPKVRGKLLAAKLPTKEQAKPIAKKTNARLATQPPAAKKARAKPGDARVRGARSDASLVKLQATIEDHFKLPRGSVQLVAPGRRRMEETDRVKDLRARWDKASASKGAR